MFKKVSELHMFFIYILCKAKYCKINMSYQQKPRNLDIRRDVYYTYSPSQNKNKKMWYVC